MPPGTTSPSREITIPLTGNSCRSCARRLQYRLRRLESVSDARVDRVKNAVTLSFDEPGSETAALEAIRQAGFDPFVSAVTLPVPALGYGAECQSLEAQIEAEPGVKRAAARPGLGAVEVEYFVGTTTIDAARLAARRAGFDARHPETAFDTNARQLGRRRMSARTAAGTVFAAIAATFLAVPFFWMRPQLEIPALERQTAELLLAAGAILLIVLLARSWMLGALRPWLRRTPSSEGLQAFAILATAAFSFSSSLPAFRETDPDLPFTAYPALFWVIAFISISRWLIARISGDEDERPRELDAISRKLTILSAAAAVLAFFIWFVLGQEPALVNAMTAFAASLAASCTSVAAVAATASITRRNRAFRSAGIGVNSGAALRQLDGVDLLAFEVHGTLTTGQHRLSEYVLMGGLTQKDLLRMAAALAAGSSDRVLRALDAHAPKPMPSIDERAEMFRGISAHVDGVQSLLGHPDWVRARGVSLDDVEEDLARFAAEGRSVRVLAVDRGVAGVLAFREELRPEARSELERIRTLRLPLQLLSDADEAALTALGKSVGVERRLAGSPADQRAEISRLRRQGRRVALLTTEPSGAVASAADVAIILGASPFADIAVEDLGAAATASEIWRGSYRATRSLTRFAVFWHLLVLPAAAFPATAAWPALAAASATAATAFALWSACCRPIGGAIISNQEGRS